MRYIKLSPYDKGYQAVIDDDDYDMVSKWCWKYDKHTGYAVRNASLNNKPFVMYMHRLVNNTPKGEITDHINRDKLDNRKENLRSTDKSGNALNSVRTKKTASSGYKGVYLHHPREYRERGWAKRWKFTIQRKGRKTFESKYYKTPEEAHLARLKKLEEYIY